MVSRLMAFRRSHPGQWEAEDFLCHRFAVHRAEKDPGKELASFGVGNLNVGGRWRGHLGLVVGKYQFGQIHLQDDHQLDQLDPGGRARWRVW